MIDKIKVINFLQDFGCAKLEHLQTLFSNKNDNFNCILSSNIISKKDNIFIHNTKKLNINMIYALDILCKYKGRFIEFYQGYEPVYISFLSNENLLYHIIVASEENQKGIAKIINSYPLSIPKADKLILIFPDEKELVNIDCDIPFLYTTPPDYKILNVKK